MRRQRSTTQTDCCPKSQAIEPGQTTECSLILPRLGERAPCRSTIGRPSWGAIYRIPLSHRENQHPHHDPVVLVAVSKITICPIDQLNSFGKPLFRERVRGNHNLLCTFPPHADA